MTAVRILLTGVWLIIAAGCGTVDYAKLDAARFSGSVIVMWLGEGGSSGDGRFLFVPDPKSPLTFRRANTQAPGSIIRPRLMYTDGGSIPKIASAFRGFSPWGYAPAYMIHDWLFIARHCLLDGAKEAKFTELSDVEFDDSAKILGEAIHALVSAGQVQRNDLAGATITTAVDSVIARRLWDTQGACAESRIRPEHVAAAEAAITGSSQKMLQGNAFPTLSGARIVTRVTF